MEKLQSKFNFKGMYNLDVVLENAKAKGYEIDKKDFNLGGDWVWLRRMYPKGFEMPVQVRYNTCNGRFTASIPVDERTYTESSTDMEGIDWYDELLLIVYIPDLKPGDKITVNAQGIRVTGTVHSAEHYEREGWYIEIAEANVPGGYSYWKQREDGGIITKWIPASEGGKA